MKVLSIIGIILFGALSLLMCINIVIIIVGNIQGFYKPPTYMIYASIALGFVMVLGLIFSIKALRNIKK